MSINGSFRKKEKGFVMVSHVAARDENLSHKAKGLYLMIESYLSIPDWVLYKDFLMSKSKEGRDAFNSAWKELKDRGYLKQEKTKSDEGKWIYIYDLLESPIIEPKIEEKTVKEPETIDPGHSIPGTENPCVGLSCVGNTPLYNNIEYNNIEYTNNKENRKEKIKEKVETTTTQKSVVPTAHYFSDLPGKAPILPGEFIEDLDPFFVKRLLKDRNIYDLNFSENPLYSIFAEAVTKTQIQDDVEILTIRQYPYFIKTLQNMLEPYRKKINVLKLLEKDNEV